MIMTPIEYAMLRLGYSPEQTAAQPNATVQAKRLAVAANTQAAQVIRIEKVEE